MFKLVHATIHFVEEKLNAAYTDGYTIMAREYVLPDGSFAFLMKRPRDVAVEIDCEEAELTANTAPTDPPPPPATE